MPQMKDIDPRLWTGPEPYLQIGRDLIYAIFPIEVHEPISLRIRVISERSTVQQGVVVRVDNGRFEGPFSKLRSCVTWYDHEPWLVLLNVTPTSKWGPCTIRIWNAWKGKKGELREWGGNAAIRVDKTETKNCWRLHCSRGDNDVDFKSLIIQVELICPPQPYPTSETEPSNHEKR
jgi:hypothetical protein